MLDHTDVYELNTHTHTPSYPLPSNKSGKINNIKILNVREKIELFSHNNEYYLFFYIRYSRKRFIECLLQTYIYSNM